MIDSIPEDFLIEGELTFEQSRIFIEQINRFNELNDTYSNVANPLFDENGRVILNTGTIIHGTSRYDEERLDNISRTGILTGQAVGISEDGETYYCADFHRVDNRVNVCDYSEAFSYNDGRCPFGKRADNSYAVAFIVPFNDSNRELLSYDCYRDGTIESEITRSFINNMPLDDKNKASSILYGVPSSCIEGIIVGGRVLSDKNKIDFLIQKFPKCYIASSFGEIIYNPCREEKLGDEIVELRREKTYLEMNKRNSLKVLKSQSDNVINLINKNIGLIDLIKNNCDISNLDILEVLPLLKNILKDLLGKAYLEEFNEMDVSSLLEFITNYLVRDINQKRYNFNYNDIFILKSDIIRLKEENIEIEKKIQLRDLLIKKLNNQYDNLWNQMLYNCKSEEIANVLIDMGWQGNVNIEYVDNMRKGYGR